MQVSDQMIQAAVSKAMELGVLPRKSLPDDIATNSEIMAAILQAAVDAQSKTGDKPRSVGPHKP
jgi:hypothetical protein